MNIVSCQYHVCVYGIKKHFEIKLLLNYLTYGIFRANGKMRFSIKIKGRPSASKPVTANDTAKTFAQILWK